MYIYNVSIKILPNIESEWLKWMKESHMNEVLATGMFDEASLYRLIEPVDEDGITYIAQYKTTHEARYHKYIEEYAIGLREKGYEKFGNQFIAFRTILQQC
ncbi:MAG: DUF4286 family protein [Bacteroidetes bacterium]|nr:DUF4286 family protein [Bacteroidota bacterium]